MFTSTMISLVQRSALLAVTLGALFLFTNSVQAAHIGWDMTGSYTLEFTCVSGCSGTYVHTLHAAAGDLSTGDGFFIANPSISWDVTSGSVSGNDMTLSLEYNNINPGYTVELAGMIHPDGSMSGDAVSSSGQVFTFETTSGAGTFRTFGEIIEPGEDEIVYGTTDLVALYFDESPEDNDDAVNWAVRPYSPTCSGGGNLFGGGPQVSGVINDSPFAFDGHTFEAEIDTSLVPAGHYCFVFNPTDDAGQNDVRVIQNFFVAETYVSVGGRIQEEVGPKRKNWLDVSFGGWVADIGELVGEIQINFHNVNDETVVSDKSKFHADEIVGLNYADGDSSTCEAAMNFTAHGSFNGEDGWSVVVRSGDNDDTMRVQLFDTDVVGAPTSGHVYDTHMVGEFTDESSCRGTARTGLDAGNISITDNS